MATQTMTSRTPTSAMAVSALFYGYGSRSSHSSPATVWWDEKKIISTVTRDYVGSKLRNEQKAQLDQGMCFGEDLTDETYSSWILGKTRRLFLILLDVGAPGEIFKLVDRSLDDEDLPIPLESLETLSIAQDKDGNVAKNFFKRQFTYMLRGLSEGDHISYASDEVVPVELVSKRTLTTGYQSAEKVTLSDKYDEVYVRRRIELGSKAGRILEKEFLHDVEAMKSITHKHIVSIYATYTYQSCGYVLLTPATDLSLRNFLTIPPPQFRILTKQERRRTVLSWLHCLASAMTFLHDKGISHGEIQPSNILIDASNNALLGVPSKFRILRTDKRPSTLESYEYGSPEKWLKACNTPQTPSSNRKATPNKEWKLSIQSAPTPITEYFNFSSGASSPISARSWPNRAINVGAGWRSESFDPIRADIYSLGCIYLDVLTYLLKRKTASFISHRSAKNKKSTGIVRSISGAATLGPADASFHANGAQVTEWIALLRRDSFRRKDTMFDGVPALLVLCTGMLDRSPDQRPEAWEVEERVADVLGGMCHISGLHCGRNKSEAEENWDFCCSGQAREFGAPMRARGWSRSSGSTAEGRERRPWEVPVLPDVAELGVAY